MADIGRGAAHVEADQPVKARRLAGFDHADDAAGRTRQNGILALKEPCVGQPAVRLHEQKPIDAAFGEIQGIRHLIDISAQDRREIGIDHGRIAAPDKLGEARNLVAGGDLGEPDVRGDLGCARFVDRVQIGVQEGDGDSADAFGMGRCQRLSKRVFVQRGQISPSASRRSWISATSS